MSVEQSTAKLKDDVDIMCIRPGNKENLNRFMLFKIIHMHACMKIIKPQKGSRLVTDDNDCDDMFTNTHARTHTL